MILIILLFIKRLIYNNIGFHCRITHISHANDEITLMLPSLLHKWI